MSHERSDFREALRAEARRALAAEPRHPSLERLVAYHDGEVRGAEAEAVRDHLALCRECADLLLDYRDFAREEPAGTASAAGVAWERHREAIGGGVRRRVGGSETREEAGEAGRPARSHEAPRPGSPPFPSRVEHSGWPRTVPWAAAACLALVSVVLGTLWWQARTELRQPGPAVFASLAPEGAPALRGSGDPEVVEVAVRPGTRTVVLLNLSEPAAHPRYEARIVPPAGEAAAREVELEPGPNGVLALELGADPEPGPYRVVLSGIADGERQELATYRFEVSEP